MIKIIELFGGIGALSTAFELEGIPFEIVDYVEIDKYAVKSFNAMHGTNFKPQDIREWDKDIKTDFIMHGSPCQDFSLAGKQKGGDEGSGTRSSLLYETLRIVAKLNPKYVLWENVANILSDKHKHNFDTYLKRMEETYENYWKVLNAKDYGIPQNRARVFTLSILGGGYFRFPPKKKLTTCLKDYLEKNVDKKYYLSVKQIMSFRSSSFVQYKHLSDSNGIASTLLSRDYKGPQKVYEIHQVGELNIKGNDQIKRVYSPDGLCPTLTTSEGGNRQPKIIEATKCVHIDSKSLVRKYEVDTVALKNLLRSNRKLSIKEISEKMNLPKTKVEHWFRNDDSFAIPDPEYWLKLKNLLEIETDEFDHSIMDFIEKDNNFDYDNRLYSEDGICSTLMSNNNNTKIIQTTKCINSKVNGKQPSLQNRIYDENGCMPALTGGFRPSVLIRTNTKLGYEEAKDGDSINLSYPNSKTRRGRVGHGVAQTLEANNVNQGVIIQSYIDLSDTNRFKVYEKQKDGTIIYEDELLDAGLIWNPATPDIAYYIRKLTPLEYWRLQGFPDEYFYRAKAAGVSNSQLYKQSGNSISVPVLRAIIRQIFKDVDFSGQLSIFDLEHLEKK